MFLDENNVTVPNIQYSVEGHVLKVTFLPFLHCILVDDNLRVEINISKNRAVLS